MGYLEENKDKIIDTPGGNLCQVFGKNENASCSIALVKMNENSKGVYHYHDNITEIYVFSKGKGTITINGNINQINSCDCFVIPPKNGHLIISETQMEFECICIPPWEEEHEFILEENTVISDLKVNKQDTYGKINDIQENIYYDNLKTGNSIENIVESECMEVYYFSKGTGKIIIDGKENIINEAQCYLLNSNSKYRIIADTDLIYSKVIEKKI